MRRAEMKGLEELPAGEKKKLLPIILLAPWVSSNKFENTFDRIAISHGGNPLIADLDLYYESDSKKESREYFNMLSKGEDSHIKWVDLIHQHNNYIPTVQLQSKSEVQIKYQLDAFLNLKRGVVFRLEIQRYYDYDLIFSLIDQIKSEDILVVLDAGWSQNVNTSLLKVIPFIEKIVEVSEDIPFVITSSNFPNEFSEYDNIGSLNIGSRRLFDELKVRFGNYKLYYGDWGSTKPRRYTGGGNKPLPRIDYPTRNRWIIARSKEENWDFKDSADRITRLVDWDNHPNVWGAALIEKTAEGTEGGIFTGPQAIAARINIHLFIQNNFKVENFAELDTDEPWTDPI